MPSIKIPKKSTAVDMTPFVDVAFLILTFFIMATKFKPADPVEIKTPNSVSSKQLKETNSVQVTMAKDGKVYFNATVKKDNAILDQLIQNINKTMNMNLTTAQMANFKKSVPIGVPFAKVGQLLSLPPDQQQKIKQEGMPVDSTGGDLTFWIQAAKQAFAGNELQFLIKGDNDAKYPVFKNVITALKKNDELKYNLITSAEEAPAGTELAKERAAQTKK